MLSSARYKCRFVIIWSVLFLLQQFQLVLLLNINIIGKNAKVGEKLGFSTNARQNIKSSEKATLKSSSALKNRVKVISRLNPKLKNASTHLSENSKVSFKKAIFNSKVKHNRHLKKLAKPANKLMRCRRMIKQSCSVPNQNLIEKAFGYNETTDLPNKWKDQFDELLSEIDMTNGQFAVVGVRQSDIFVYKNSSNIDNMRKVTKRPIPKENFDIENNTDNTNVMHTEQYLFSTMEDSFQNCTKAKPCEVFLYTKLSPCTQHPQTYAESCLKYIVSTCKKWFLDKGTRCHVGFGKFFDNNKEVFTSQWDEYFKSFMDNRKYAGKKDELLKNMGFSQETIRNIDELLKENVEKIRANLLDRITNKGYKELKKNINFDFRDAYNKAVKYFKDEKPNMADLAVKFKKELSPIDTTVKDLGIRFENLIDNLSSKYPSETLNVEKIKENLETMAKEAYHELKENVNVDFSVAFNNALNYLKGSEPNTAGLVDKFKTELSKIHQKTVKRLVTRFEKMINDWNAQYARETLNKVATKRTVMSDITEVTKGIEKAVIDFSFYQLN